MLVFCWLFLLLPAWLEAATLPDENVDLFYHRYEGGGMTIDGPVSYTPLTAPTSELG